VLYELNQCTDHPDRGHRLVYVNGVVQPGVLQHWATFKRCSNGTPLFTLFSANEEPSDSFNAFVADVIAVVRRERTTLVPSQETGITPAEARRNGAGVDVQDTYPLLRATEWSDSVLGQDAWSCVCQLYSDRLLLQQTIGAESSSEWMEFRYCDPSPRCTVRTCQHWIRREVMFKHVADGRPYFGLRTASAFPDAIDFVVAMRQAEKWKANPAEASADAFECFVGEVITAIKRADGRDPGLAHSIEIA
jgi:hypothetical protein